MGHETPTLLRQPQAGCSRPTEGEQPHKGSDRDPAPHSWLDTRQAGAPRLRETILKDVRGKISSLAAGSQLRSVRFFIKL